jgi:predicted DNA-binding protein YlxM (UPF0122 family)
MHITEKHRPRHQNRELNSLWLKINESEIANLYLCEKLSCCEIARRFNTDNCTIRRHLNAQGIILRPFNEQVSLGIHKNIDKYIENSSGQNNPAYIHGKKVGQKANRKKYLLIAKQTKKWQCERCGIKRPSYMDLVVHHIDKNNTNNTPDNLMILCQRCHAHIHFSKSSDKEREDSL